MNKKIYEISQFTNIKLTKKDNLRHDKLCKRKKTAQRNKNHKLLLQSKISHEKDNLRVEI